MRQQGQRAACVLGMVCLLLLTGRAGAAIMFSSAADMALFNRNGNAATTFNWNATAGVGGGGGLLSSSINYDSDAMVLPTPIANIVGASFFVQLDYRMQLQSTGPDVRVGVTTTATGSFNGNLPTSAWVETYGASTPKNFAHSEPPSTFNLFPPVPMTPGNWFRLRLDLTKTSATTYNGTARVFDLGPTGLSAPTLLGNQTYAMTSSGVGAAAQVFAGFHLFGQTSGADNFDATSVPEPAAACSLLLLAGVSVARRRRRAVR